MRHVNRDLVDSYEADVGSDAKLSEEEKASRVVDTMTHEEPAPSRNQIRGHRTTKLITAKRKDLADKSAVSGADFRRLQASESKNVKAAGNLR